MVCQICCKRISLVLRCQGISSDVSQDPVSQERAVSQDPRMRGNYTLCRATRLQQVRATRLHVRSGEALQLRWCSERREIPVRRQRLHMNIQSIRVLHRTPPHHRIDWPECLANAGDWFQYEHTYALAVDLQSARGAILDDASPIGPTTRFSLQAQVYTCDSR